MLINKFIFSNKNFLHFLILSIPLSVMLGNLITNINIILICLFGLAKYRLRTFKLDQKVYLYLIYGFFGYVITITLVRYLPALYDKTLYIDLYKYDALKENMIKSFLYLRYLILFLVVDKLIQEKVLKIKLFFMSCAFFSSILAIDILVQVSTGSDLLGFSIVNNRPSGFFGSELVAGGYIQKFSLFFVFGLAFLFNLQKKKIYILLSLSMFFFFFSILLTNNRMSLLIFLASIFLFFLMEKKIRKFFFVLLSVSSITIFLALKIFTVSFSEKLEYRGPIMSFIYTTKQLVQTGPELFYYGKLDEPVQFKNGYLLVFNTAIQQWKKNKIFGHGMKSTIINCEYNTPFRVCTSHPHNYILEILVDVGIIGFLLIYSLFFLVTLNFIKFYKSSADIKLKFIAVPFFLIVFFEFFPLRSSGSFYTTNNSVLIFLMLAFLINISKLYPEDKKL
jgi:O-antigen ligase